MNVITSIATMPTPFRSSLSDAPRDILSFAVSAFAQGGVALATLVEIRGGAARPLGSHLAIAADGRFCGYVSGGCVEAAVASEALGAIADGCDRQVKFGEGSNFFDIRLPCGGGITVAIHLLRDIAPLQQIIRAIDRRQPASLGYDLQRENLAVVEPETRASWSGGTFRTLYRPSTRLVVSGQPAETSALVRLAAASDYDVVPINMLSPSEIKENIDCFTAVALLHHDLDAELDILETALQTRAFYIGALGSTRTHRRRIGRLRALGVPEGSIDKIKAPIGMFGPTRDSNSLALSVLADIAAARMATYPYSAG